MKQTKQWALTSIVGLALLAAACNGPQKDPNDCDYLMSAGATDQTTVAISTDVNCASALTLDFSVHVDLIAQGGASDPPPAGPGPNDEFKLDHYEVTYTNLRTGGSRVGIDVPRPYSFAIPFQPAIPPADFDTTGFEILTGSQKTQAPLNDSSFYAGQPVDLLATITVFGYPVIDPGRLCTAQFTYQFAVFQGPGC